MGVYSGGYMGVALWLQCAWCCNFDVHCWGCSQEWHWCRVLVPVQCLVMLSGGLHAVLKVAHGRCVNSRQVQALPAQLGMQHNAKLVPPAALMLIRADAWCQLLILCVGLCAVLQVWRQPCVLCWRQGSPACDREGGYPAARSAGEAPVSSAAW